MSRVRFFYKQWVRLKLVDDWDFAELGCQIEGAVDPLTGMILDLRLLQSLLTQMQNQGERANWGTLKEALEALYHTGQIYFKAYPHIQSFDLTYEQVAAGLKYIFNGQELQVEISKYMRYQDQFGRARIGFHFDSFLKLNDRERRQDLWQMGMAESPALSLKGKYPLALFWEFTHQLSGEIDYIERI